jgi:site-specific recombinase XerD
MITSAAITKTRNQFGLITQLVKEDPRLLSHHTKRAYLANLRDFLTWKGPQYLTKSVVEEYEAKLQAEGKAPATINVKVAAVRWYARKMADLAEERADDAESQLMGRQAARVALVKDVKGERPLRGRHIAAGEISALMKACEDDPSPAGRRDAALFALAWTCGLRRDEICSLTVQDVVKGENEGEADVIVRHGKGNKSRSAYLFNGAFMALADWMQVRGMDDGPLFVTIGKGGKITAAKLSGEALRKILAKRARQAGIDQVTGWHDFRRTFAGNLLDAGSDLSTVQKLMGHSDAGTTANYDRRPETTRKTAVKSLFVPYTRRK